ncbi:Gfo/Idh/MocA family oxidoreductase [Sandarakinorhabdus sp.]|uniref:Gfo/Idh/MocA family protein n=1 Tax=Sandarakinorhabdus sp. TaxID=1916663 RepID=UPI0033416A53
MIARKIGVAIIGCGYVFDKYMATSGAYAQMDIRWLWDIDADRLSAATRCYDLPAASGLDAVLADPAVELVLNLTAIAAHEEVTRACLMAGKHVYCEKPLTPELAASEALFDLAAERGVMLMAAPCNMFSDSVQTLWRALASGAIGRPLLTYAEFDDNPIYLMRPEGWRSRSGAPWPYLHEYEAGCTWEHVGYHLAWMCAVFGPVRSVTAFSRVTVPHKTDQPLHPADTPDFSVAVLDFESGVVGRITCSIAAPLDHRMRVVGDEGEMTVTSYNQYRAPVWLERFTTLTLNARKALSVRRHALLAGIFGVGGKPLGLLQFPWSVAVMQPIAKRRPSLPKRIIAAIKRRELGLQDKMLGPVLMARAIAAGAPAPLPPAFILHLNELTLAIQSAGTTAASYVPRHRFEPLQPLPGAINQPADWRATHAPGLLDRLLGPRLDAMHQH